jgi:8-oxo-dGTP pyrophosphatase MutT (NUDIX family)
MTDSAIPYFRHIRSCNGWSADNFRPFLVDDRVRGFVPHGFAGLLGRWPEVFRVTAGAVRLHPELTGFEQRNQALAEVQAAMLEGGYIAYLHGEQFPVGPDRDRPDCLLDRAMAARFGIRAWGQHLNGFVRQGDDLLLWVARRSRDKRNHPGMLDHIVAGGLPYGISLADNLAKECWEEAGISAAQAALATSVNALSYCRETEAGLKADTIYCYDLELPEDFRPRCNDGEVEEFYLQPLQEVQRLVRDTTEFKPNCNLVIIDFLIRHGALGPETAGYADLVTALHPVLP